MEAYFGRQVVFVVHESPGGTDSTEKMVLEVEGNFWALNLNHFEDLEPEAVSSHEALVSLVRRWSLVP